MISEVFGRLSEMTVGELIVEAEKLVKASKDSYMNGNLEAAKHDLLVVAGKIMGELPGPVEKPAPWPGQGQR